MSLTLEQIETLPDFKILSPAAQKAVHAIYRQARGYDQDPSSLSQKDLDAYDRGSGPAPASYFEAERFLKIHLWESTSDGAMLAAPVSAHRFRSGGVHTGASTWLGR